MPFYEMWEKKTVFLVQAESLPPGAGGPSPPVDPPQVWPGPRPSHPIMLPGMPGWAEPVAAGRETTDRTPNRTAGP